VDTKCLEQVGETFVIHSLLDAGILVAKPCFDQSGCDLIGFTSVDDKARFCRIQCKYRGVKTATYVEIDTNYVVGAFVLFVYVKTQQDRHFFCFLPEDIRRIFTQHTQGTKSVFRLSITRKTAVSLAKDKAISFTGEKVTAISNLMKSSSPDSEFRQLVSGLVRNVKEITRIQREHAKLQQLVHEIKIADLEKKACEEKLELLKEYMGFLEEHKKDGKDDPGTAGAQER
jgi:hypothetical protein